jgi:hypothetical protein
MTSTKASDPILSALVSRNQDLLARSATGDVSQAETQQFIYDVTRAGAHYPAGPFRDSLRNMLYFWSSEQYSRGGQPPEASLPQLAPYDQALAAEAVVPAKDEGAAGVVRSRQILQIAALARQWRSKSGAEAKGYLLSGKALDDARKYVDDDPDIAAFIKASDDGQKSTLIRTIVVAVAVPLLILIVALGQWLAYERARERQKEAEIAALQRAQTEWVNDKSKFYARIRTTVDGLSHNDLAPLQKLLQEYGNADPALLGRLSLAPPTAASISALSTIQAPAKFDTSVARDFAAGDGQCNGYLWFGSDRDSRIAGGQMPSSIEAGQTLTLDTRANIKLRKGFPDDGTYALQPQVGTVPGGASVTVVGPPKGFPRPISDGGTIDQIWARVSVPYVFCTTVYVQYSGEPGKALGLISAITAAGAQAPPPEQLSSAVGLAEVRYFYPQDRKVADLIAQRLGPPLQPRTIAVKDLTSFANKPAEGTMELWIDLAGS